MLAQMPSFEVKDVSPMSIIQDISRRILESKQLTTVQLKNLATEFRIQEWESSRTMKLYSYFVLIVICVANMGSSWQDSLLAPAYNYPYQNLPANQISYYWIGSVIGDTVNFSTISGTAIIIPLLLSSFCAGLLAEKLNRKWLFLVSLGLVGLCTFAISFSNSYAQIFCLTMVYGFC